MMNTVLIVDDIPAVCEQYAYDLKRLGDYHTFTATSGEKALALLVHQPLDCIVLDLEMPGMDGFAVLTELGKREWRIPVIVYTGTGSYERCVRAVKLGAYSFIDKAEPMERVVREIENAVRQHRLASEVADLKEQLGVESPLIGDSPAMVALKKSIARIARIPSTVLIVGESGSGKELVARGIHKLSARSAEPFVAINCAALPEGLIESELFGHERGAFTGATNLRRGAFENASRGTLFLDEVGELHASVQGKLLRVLEGTEIRRLGGDTPIRVDVRVLAATNRNLEEEIAAKRFRQDLYFRLNVHILAVPPLRERLGDVPALLEHFLGATCKRFGMRRKTLAVDAVQALRRYAWQRNNVRELRNIVERMVIACDGDEIQLTHVPAEIRQGGTAPRGAASAFDSPPLTLRDRKAQAEREIVVAALERNGWQITKTASELGLADHSSLLKIMRRHGLKRRG